MTSDIETNTKQFITSILTANPLRTTMMELAKEYRNTIGEPIPYQKLGYTNLEHFLRSIPDTVLVKGCGPTAEVIRVFKEKSAHVGALVGNQRINKPKSRPGHYRRPTLPGPRRQMVEYQHNQNVPKPVQKIYYPNPQDSSSKSSSISSGSLDYVTNNIRVPSDDDPLNLKGFVNNLNIAIDSDKFECDKKDNKKKEVKAIEKKIAKELKKMDNPRMAENYQKAAEPKSPGVVPTKANILKNFPKKLPPEKRQLDAVENNVPYNIRNNLKVLIGQFPEGIWCADVPKVYRRMFGQDIDYQELGFRSLIDLCTCLSSIFHYVMPATDDFKLYDRSRPLPACAEKVFTVASYSVSKKDQENNSALPSLDWEELIHYLPEHVFKGEIPRAFIPQDMKEGDNFDVVVGEIYDLSKFWIYLKDSLLDTLMDDMQTFYKAHAEELAISDEFIQEGLYCAQVIFGEYHRALIVNTMPDTAQTIRVIFIDYGTMSKISTVGLCFLHVDFAQLPAQAIRCRLANVVPPDENAIWSREATKSFRQLVSRRDVTAKISGINWEHQFLEVYLADVTDESNIFFVNDILIQQGFAVGVDQERRKTFVEPICTPKVKFIHLFPTFLELEYGLAPSTGEMEIFHECDVPINFCYPQYFDIDWTSEENITALSVQFNENNCIKGIRTLIFQFYEFESLKSSKPNLSVFGDLEADIAKYLGSVPEQNLSPCSNECFEDVLEDPSEIVDEKSAVEVGTVDNRLEAVNEKVVTLSSKEEETINKLRNDFMLTESIMKDLNFVCYNGSVSIETQTYDCQVFDDNLLVDENFALQHYNGYTERELWTINEARESVGSANSSVVIKECSDSDIKEGQLIDHPVNYPPSFQEREISDAEDLCNEEMSIMDRPLSQPAIHESPSSSWYNDDQFNLENIEVGPSLEVDVSSQRERCFEKNLDNSAVVKYDRSANGSDCCDETGRGSKSTNPFMDTSEEANNLTLSVDVKKLNPNNPFISFLTSNSEQESDSSSSTTYESFSHDNKIKNSWEDYDDISPDTISLLGRSLRSGSNSSDSVRMKSTAATQTSDEEAGMSRTQCSQYQSAYPPVPSYSCWSPGYSNPYAYNVRFTANFQNFGYQPMPYDSGNSYRPPPPPGFGQFFPPQGNMPGMPGQTSGSTPRFSPAQFMQPPRPFWSPTPPTYFPSPSQVSACSGAPLVLSLQSPDGSSRSEGKDFYASYNERLKKLVIGDGTVQDEEKGISS